MTSSICNIEVALHGRSRCCIKGRLEDTRVVFDCSALLPGGSRRRRRLTHPCALCDPLQSQKMISKAVIIKGIIRPCLSEPPLLPFSLSLLCPCGALRYEAHLMIHDTKGSVVMNRADLIWCLQMR